VWDAAPISPGKIARAAAGGRPGGGSATSETRNITIIVWIPRVHSQIFKPGNEHPEALKGTAE